MRYVLALFLPPASVCRLGCNTAPPIAVFWVTALATLALVPAWTVGWLSLAAFFWLAATTWAVLTLWAADADARAVPASNRHRHADPEQHYPGEGEIPKAK